MEKDNLDDLYAELDEIDSSGQVKKGVTDDLDDVVDLEEEVVKEKPKPKKATKSEKPKLEVVPTVSLDHLNDEEMEALEGLEKESSVKLIFGQEGFAAQMQNDVKVGRDVDKCFKEQASLFAYYAEQTSKASKSELELKMKIELVEATLDGKIRAAAAENGEKITEKMIEQKVAVDKTVIALRRDYIQAKTDAQLMKDMLEAFRQRRDMLIQIGTNEREDRKGQLRLASRDDLDVKSA